MACLMRRATWLVATAALLAAAGVNGQGFETGQGLLPSGNLRTSDAAGPYDIHLLDVQSHEIRAAQAARNGFSDRDIIDFLVNVECLEGQFDTWGAFGFGFHNNLSMGGPTPVGARKANLSPEALPFVQEIALSEQGHALLTRQAGSVAPCPYIDFDKGFNEWYAEAYNLDWRNGETVEKKFGKAFDPFLNDETFITSMLGLEELGATGNKGLAGILGNPVLSNAVAGLATAASSFATLERKLLWERRDKIVEPFGETVQQVFARVSAMRDRLDGPQLDDQGLVNTDPRHIAVPADAVNMIPTDIRGLTYSRTPQMNINIVTLGAKDGKGGFFPKGLNGAINTPAGYDKMNDGFEDWPSKLTRKVAYEATKSAVGGDKLPPPITPEYNPLSVPGQDQLNGNELAGHPSNEEASTRGHSEL